jgi:hypothetical protein
MEHIILNLYCTFDKRYFCVSDSRLYSLHENLLKKLLKKNKQTQKKTTFFFLQQVEQTLTLCTIIRHAYFNTFITKGYLYFEAV